MGKGRTPEKGRDLTKWNENFDKIQKTKKFEKQGVEKNGKTTYKYNDK